MGTTRKELVEMLEWAYDDLELICRNLTPSLMSPGRVARLDITIRELRTLQARIVHVGEDTLLDAKRREAQTNLRIMQEGFARAFMERTGLGPDEIELCQVIEKQDGEVKLRWYFKKREVADGDEGDGSGVCAKQGGGKAMGCANARP